MWYSKAVFASVFLFVFLGIFLRWKTEAKVRRTLAFMAVLITLSCALDLLLCEHFSYHPLMLHSGSSFGTLFLGLILTAFIYLYAMQILRSAKLTTWLLLRLNMPLIISVVGYLILSLFPFESLPSYSLLKLIAHLSHNPFALWWLLTALSFVIYAGYAMVRITLWAYRLSQQKKTGVYWHGGFYYLSFATYAFLGLTIVGGLIFYLSIENREIEPPGFLALAGICFLFYLLSYLHTRLPQAPDDASARETIGHSTLESRSPKLQDKLLLGKLNELLIQEKFYTRIDLSTTILAEQLGISRKKLYLLISEHYNTTFTDYINGYRLEHAARLMSEKENLNLTIVQIAEMSGFNSLKTCIKFFKLKYSKTPTQYRNSIHIH